MKSAALLTLGLLAVCGPATAKSHHGHYGHRYAARTVHHASLAHRARFAHRAHFARHANLDRHTDAAHHVASEQESHSGITCEMVRAYVAKVGLAQAAAMAQSAGITASEKDRAKRCLEQKS